MNLGPLQTVHGRILRGAERPPPPPPAFDFCIEFLYINFVTDRLSSSGIVQSAQGCSCVVGMEGCCALAEYFSSPLSEISGFAPAIDKPFAWFCCSRSCSFTFMNGLLPFERTIEQTTEIMPLDSKAMAPATTGDR